MTAATWCKSGTVPITVGMYRTMDGTVVAVRQGRSRRFYAGTVCPFYPHMRGLIYRLRAELDAGTAVKLP